MRLLIIEDEELLQQALSKGFKKLGYTTDVADDGENALDYYFSNVYDLIILDLNLPKLDGMEVLKEIRSENKNIPVLILSARSEVKDKVIGLDCGANDYLAKPFYFDELDARARALLRRSFKTADTVITIGKLRIDTAIKRVYIDNLEINLSKKEYGILEYLMLNKGIAISIEELVERIWDNESDNYINSFKVHISSLRKKLSKDIIKNTRGQGYYVE
jgi:Response regulators consisting of a CheY-like receiver domain and a winged-helix DNA-binding domain